MRHQTQTHSTTPTTLAIVSPIELWRHGRALLKFGKMKGRSLMSIYHEEPDYMRWLVENAMSATSPSETDRFLARVAVRVTNASRRISFGDFVSFGDFAGVFRATVPA